MHTYPRVERKVLCGKGNHKNCIGLLDETKIPWNLINILVSKEGEWEIYVPIYRYKVTIFVSLELAFCFFFFLLSTGKDYSFFSISGPPLLKAVDLCFITVFPSCKQYIQAHIIRGRGLTGENLISLSVTTVQGKRGKWIMDWYSQEAFKETLKRQVKEVLNLATLVLIIIYDAI